MLFVREVVWFVASLSVLLEVVEVCVNPTPDSRQGIAQNTALPHLLSLSLSSLKHELLSHTPHMSWSSVVCIH